MTLCTSYTCYAVLTVPVPHVLGSDGAKHAVRGPHWAHRGTIRTHVLQKPTVTQVPVEFLPLFGQHGIIQTIPVNPISCPQIGCCEAHLQCRKRSHGLHRRKAHLGGPDSVLRVVALLAAWSPLILRQAAASVPEDMGSCHDSREGSHVGVLAPNAGRASAQSARSWSRLVISERVCGGASLSRVA